MIVIVFFIFFLLLENLFLPALIGPGHFLITPIFILGLIIYGKNWKIFIFQAIPLILIEEFFTGMAVGKLLLPLGITGLVYLWANKFINFTEGLRENISFTGILSSTLFLALLGYLYSWLFIFFNTPYDIFLAWNEWKLFFTGYLLNMLGWSLVISILYKYVLKTK